MQKKSFASWFSKMSGRIPLRVILIVPFIIQLVAVVGLIGYLSFSNGQKSVYELTTVLRNEIISRIEQHLFDYLKTPHIINQINADAFRFKMLNITDPIAIQRYFWQQLQMFDSASYISFANEQGNYIGVERREDHTIAIGEKKEDQFYLYTETAEYLADNRGHQKKLTTNIKDYDPRERGWYKDTKKKNVPIWSDIYALLDATDLNLSVTQTVSANQPFFDKAGSFRGVLATDIFLSQISDFLVDLRIGKTGKTFIMERSGLIVASSTSEKPYLINPKNNEVSRLDAQNSQEPLIHHAAKYLIERFHDLKKIKSSYQLEFSLHGERQFLQVKPLQDERGIDWLIVVVIPQADFMEHINASTRLTVFLCLTALVIAILISLVISKWPVAPISRLKIAAQKLADGEWEQDLPCERSDEIGDLGKSFKSMAGQLRTMFGNLEELNKAYERFVPRQFLSCLKKDSIIDVQLGDQVQQEMSVLFSDIRAFTSMSERMSPADNFKFINAYLSRMEPAIIEHHGFIDKFIGDAIMALFSGGADDAVKAGIVMLQTLREYNTTRQRPDRLPINIGVGINTGRLILGTVGGGSRMDGTVISDSVNLASRLEGLTKMYNASLLISEFTYANLKGTYAIRCIDRVKVKGKSQPVSVYEVCDGDPSTIAELKMTTLDDFDAGLYSYRQKEFLTAKHHFNKVLQIHTIDKAAQIYIKRCEYFEQHGVPENWEGIEVLESK
jgi:adenylate cyclase